MFKDCQTRKRGGVLPGLLTRFALSTFVGGAHPRFKPFRELRFNLLLTVEQTLNRSFARFGLPGVKSLFNAAQCHVQRHVHLFPALNESPIHWTKQQMFGAPTNKCVFDFREIVEVVQLRMSRAKDKGQVQPVQRVTSPTLDFGLWTLEKRLDFGRWTWDYLFVRKPAGDPQASACRQRVQ